MDGVVIWTNSDRYEGERWWMATIQKDFLFLPCPVQHYGSRIVISIPFTAYLFIFVIISYI